MSGRRAAGKGRADRRRRVFVVSGRNDRATEFLARLLETVGLRMIEWEEAVRETNQGSPYIGDVVRAGMAMAQAIIVLFTPDDVACLDPRLRDAHEEPPEEELRGRARQNVVFEAGLALARDEQRTVLVQVGQVEGFTDIGGRHAVRLDGTPERCKELIERLTLAGCVADLRGNRWMRSGDFGGAVLPPQPYRLTAGPQGRQSAVPHLMSADESIDLARSLGLEVAVQRIEDLRGEEHLDRDIVSTAMASARSELLVADMGAAYGGPDMEIPPALKRGHYERLLAVACDETNPVRYQRIYQLVDPLEWPQDLRDQILLDHCRAMCSLNDDAGSRIALRATRRIFPYTWMIIDNEVVVLELYRFSNDGRPGYYRALVIRDPEGSLVSVFRSMWDDLSVHPDTRTVRASELVRKAN
ncbi:MAG: nucleotide-binding protein [Actinomycetota bacterium]|nr:nucleotide-binding protein [Actinomycetota bacterium]